MNRLEVLSADLAAQVHRATPAKRRAACLAACELAVAKVEIEHPLVDSALQQLRVGRVFTSQEKAEIDTLTEQLDEQYFELQQTAEKGNATYADHLRAFARARAVAALSFAGSDSREDAADAIYEAAAAVGDDKREFFAKINFALK